MQRLLPISRRPGLMGLLTPFLLTRFLLTSLVLTLLAGCAGQQLATDDRSAGLSIERLLVLDQARDALGTPYRWGGASTNGLDCSGLVLVSYRAAGLQVPRTADDQYRALPPIEAARPGDLLFFGRGSRASHVGIYAGNGQMIHAPGRGRQVTTTSLDLDYWQKRFLGAAAPAP
ncbi:C40 family peptidase [Onishia taeanensis]